MIRSVPFPSLSRVHLESNGPLFLCHCPRSSPRLASSSSSSSYSLTTYSSSRSNACMPKLEPFSRSKFDRVDKDPPLIKKFEEQLRDYCSTLERDASYGCWRAYFELKDLQKDAPNEEIEKLIIQAGGLKSLISCLHGISAIHKVKEEGSKSTKTLNKEKKEEAAFHVPDGLPKSAKEVE